MATAGATVRQSGGLGSLSVGIYLLLMAFILFNYLRALLQLFPFRERILGGYGILMAPRFSATGLLVACVAILVVVLFYRRILGLVNHIPIGIRGLVLPVPFYFLATRDLILTAILVILGATLWVLYRPLGALAYGVLKPIPRSLLEPLARFWAGILYTALITRAILPVAIAIAVLVGYHFLDRAVEWLFAPVWNWHRSLPNSTWMGLFVGRLVVGATAPFLLSMYFAWFNWGYDTATPVFAVLVGLIGYFVLRMPRGTAPVQQTG